MNIIWYRNSSSKLICMAFMTYPPICHENPNSSQAHLESIVYYHKHRLSHARGQQPLGIKFVCYGHALFMGPLVMFRWHAIIGRTLSQSREKIYLRWLLFKLALNEYSTSLFAHLACQQVHVEEHFEIMSNISK